MVFEVAPIFSSCIRAERLHLNSDPLAQTQRCADTHDVVRHRHYVIQAVPERGNQGSRQPGVGQCKTDATLTRAQGVATGLFQLQMGDSFAADMHVRQ